MNTTKLLNSLFLSFVFIANLSYSQTYQQGKVRVIIKAQSCYPQTTTISGTKKPKNNSTYVQTSNNQFNQILQQYEVSQMVQCMSFAKTKELRDLYELTTTMSENDLFNSLNQINSNNNLFLSVEKCPIPISLYDPVDYMWTAFADDWLWHLKKIEADKAWDITLGDPNLKIAVIDEGVDSNHPDLLGKLNPPYDFYNGNPFNLASHGTAVCTTLAGETTEQGGTANGQLASIGFNCKMMFSNYSNGVDKAVYASSVLNARIISLSWFTNCSPFISQLLAEQEILDNGTAIIRAAGNGNFHCNGGKLYPFSGFEDPRTIVISSTGQDDRHVATYADPDFTHSHYNEVDLCSPGYCIMTGTYSSGSTWPYYGCSGGTSFATPVVSGTAGLMLSVNPCLNNVMIQDILKNTTDPIVDASSFPGKVGTGRLNAYKAVLQAQAIYSPNLDLYIKDRPEDLGRQDFPYDWQVDRDESPDIWVRNQQDGQNNQTHQEPEYQSSAPVWVYVRVRNKSCMTSSGSETLNLHVSKASSWSSWPQNWDGSQPTIGYLIESKAIPSLEPGEETIIEIRWDILNPYIHNNWGSCLLARIENSPLDPITIHPGRLDDDVFYNNSVALRNVTIIDILPGLAPPGDILSVYYPHGNHVFIGNIDDTPLDFDFDFGVDQERNGGVVAGDVKVKMIFDQVGWTIMEQYLINNPDVQIIQDKEIILTHGSLHIEHVHFPPNTRIPVYYGFEITNQGLQQITNMVFHLRQYMSTDKQLLGGVHFELNYDKNGNHGDHLHNIGPGTENPNKIIKMSPNPAENHVKVDYVIVQGNQAKLMIIDESRANVTEHTLDISGHDFELNLTGMHSGNYSIVLLVDGAVQDSESLLIAP